MKSILRRAPLAILAAVALGPCAPAQYWLYFGGTGGAVRVDEPRLPAEVEQLAVAFWVRTSASIRRTVYLVSQWQHDAKAAKPAEGAEAVDLGRFHVAFTATNRLAFGIRNQEGKLETVGGRATWRDGAWHHVAACWDGAALSVYLDGKSVGRREIPEFGKIAISARPLIIGPTALKKGQQPPVFDGFIADVALWDAARGPEVMAQAWRKPIDLDDPNLVAHYALRRDAPSATVEDRAGTGAVGRVSEALARAGWCHTLRWDDPEPMRPHFDLFCYDLQAAAGPAEIRGDDRQILVSNEKTGQVGVLWQNADTRSIRITWVDALLGNHETIEIGGHSQSGRRRGGILAAGTTDPQGNIYYLVFQEAPRNRSESAALGASIHKASPDGTPLAESAIDTTRSAFNVWSYGGRWHANLRHSKGMLGLVLPRTMYMARDGLRHQGAIAVVFSAKTLEVVKMLGTTSSHSMGNILTLGAKGEFLALDLGDNYPRGVHLHKFTAASKASGVVFTFKTAHGTRPRNGSPVYDEISGNGKTFYKWSNDNATYSELGGVVEGRRGYSVIFSTDQSLQGKVLDNSRAFRGCDDPRNLALLKVVKGFQKAGGGSEVRDSLMTSLPKGNVPETGGFFNFAGRWARQRVTGVHWLTRYEAGEAARSPQVMTLRDGGTLILWEKIDRDGGSLRAMKIDRKGAVPDEPVRIDLPLRLNPRDRLLKLDGRIYLLASEREGGPTRLFFLADDV